MKTGFIAINKPQDYTSFDVVAVLRRLFWEKRIGHTGTLDPMATGVLVVLVGYATKAVPLLEDAHKKYIADFKFGVATDTQDITGEVIKTCESHITREELENILDSFRGEISQIPPMYSAVWVDGKRLYDLARQGIEVERKERKVTISELNLISFDEETQSGKIEIRCSKGTYIRTLCADIGEKLGTLAVMTALHRTEASLCTIEDTITLDEARALAEKGELELQSIDKLFMNYEAVEISGGQTVRFKHGNSLILSRVFDDETYKDGEVYRVYHKDEFLGLGKVRIDRNELSVFKLFVFE